MVHLYVTPTCLSCRKARIWLKENGIEYEEHNLFSAPLSLPELKTILQLTEEGAADLLSVRSQAFQKLGIDLEEVSLCQLFQLIQKNPHLLQRPIIMDDQKLVIGYNEDEMPTFLPRKVRKAAFQRIPASCSKEVEPA